MYLSFLPCPSHIFRNSSQIIIFKIQEKHVFRNPKKATITGWNIVFWKMDLVRWNIHIKEQYCEELNKLYCNIFLYLN
jgi:transcription initiation factor IIE alpha subunit